MTNGNWLAPVVLLALALPGTAAAAALQCDPKFDINHDGIVSKGKELEVCLLHATSAVYAQYDKNLNGKLDPDEIDALNADARNSNQFIEAQQDAADALDGKPGLSVKPKEPSGGASASEPPPAYTSTSGLLLRKAYDPLSVLAVPKTDVSKVSGAQFSFDQDFGAGDLVLSGAGAAELYKSWALSGKALAPGLLPNGLVEAAINVGAEFNRNIDSSSPKKDINSLTLRAGFEAGIQEAHYNFLRADVFDATNFDFNGHIIGAEAEWEPVDDALGIGQAREIAGLPLSFEWRPILHAEYQNVVDAGSSGQLTQGANYLFVGPVVTGNLFFSALPRFYMTGTLWAMWDALGKASPFQYGEADANWALDRAGHYALTAIYKTGNLPKTRQAVNDLSLGLTAKF